MNPAGTRMGIAALTLTGRPTDLEVFDFIGRKHHW
jgi:hypothetical protein